jgi:signal transduction histidine kinase
VLRGIQIGLHVLFAVLVAIGAASAAARTDRPVPALLGGAALAAWYAGGGTLAERRRTVVAGRIWLAVLVAGWLALVIFAHEFSWVAFALFFLSLHLLPVRGALAGITVLTGAVVAVQLASGTGNPLAQVLGPCLGAGVAIAVAAGYRRLAAVSEARRLLVAQLVAAQDDLVAVQDELAAAQREAGALGERARLARDIHDTLAQGFSSIVLLSRAALTAPSEDAPATLRSIESTATDNLEEARRVVHALAPAALDDAPLPAALGRLLDRFSAQSQVAAGLSVDGDAEPIPTPVEVALLRLAQGALANVRQHAGATRVGVTLTYRDDEVSLDVVDDGRGFAPDRVEAAPLGGTGFGLRAMRERLGVLGGELVVESAPGEGTAIVATVPLGPGGHG